SDERRSGCPKGGPDWMTKPAAQGVSAGENWRKPSGGDSRGEKRLVDDKTHLGLTLGSHERAEGEGDLVGVFGLALTMRTLFYRKLLMWLVAVVDDLAMPLIAILALLLFVVPPVGWLAVLSLLVVVTLKTLFYRKPLMWLVGWLVVLFLVA
ncbi:MAG: hypothetical protein ORN28_06005, partial [Rhodoferax sp.]|nr:hypothetical protein [Rhodoferax sp.]